MLISGLSIYPDRLPAVVIPPMLSAPATQASPVTTELQVVPAYAAEWQQHPNQYDRTLQELYDMHAKLILTIESTGTQLDKLI